VISAGLTVDAGESLSVDSASSLEIGGRSNAVAGSIVVDAGHSLIGTGVIADPLLLNGVLLAQNGVLQVTAGVSGAGSVAASPTGTVEIGGAFDGRVGGAGGSLISIGGGGVTISDTVPFGQSTVTLDQTNVQTANSVAFATAPGQTLSAAPGILSLSGCAGGGDVFIGSASAFNGETIQNWATADTLDLTNIGFATVHLCYAGSAGGGTLTVADGTHAAAIGFAGALTSANFGVLGSDGGGGTVIGWKA